MNIKIFLISLPVYIAIFMAEIDVSIVNIALPTITKELNASTGEISRIVMLYLITMTSLVLLFGKLSDLFGKKYVFMSGYALFTISSLFCGLSSDILSLQIFRALQGIGGAMLFATTNAIILQNISEDMLGRAFGFIGVFSSIALVMGAPLGGLLISHFHWRWIFYINILPGIAGFLIAYKVLKNEKNFNTAFSDIDFWGAFLSIVMIGSFVFTLNIGQEKGWLSLTVILSFCIFILSLIFFILREKNFKEPIVNFKLFRIRSFSYGILAGILNGMVMSGFVFVFPFFFERVMNFNVQNTGFIMSIFPVFSILMSPVGGMLADKKDTRLVCIISTIFLLLSVILFALLLNSTKLYFIIISFVLLGSSISVFMSSNVKLIMKERLKNYEGIMSALSTISTFIGAILGVCVFATVFSLPFPYGYNFMTVSSEFMLKGFSYSIICGICLCLFSIITLLILYKPGMIKSSITADNEN